jgi:hypothetical protein
MENKRNGGFAFWMKSTNHGNKRDCGFDVE